MKSKIIIGCSGWNYKDWKGKFYPKELTQKQWFGFYASRFSSVEINFTFYRLPEEKVFRNWAQQAPEHFVYAVKANRFITHLKRLRDPEQTLQKFIERSRLLGKHLGPLLFQLPPSMKKDIHRLRDFIEFLPRTGLEYVFEFRNKTWYDDIVYTLLDEKGISMCLHDMTGSESPIVCTGEVIYVRFHGTGGKYAGSYAHQELERWLDAVRSPMRNKKQCYFYFNNDVQAQAPKDAKVLEKICRGPERGEA